MAWYKVDDTLHSHPKVRRASLGALGLWTACGSYCMAYKTDGFVPAYVAHAYPRGKSLSAELVRVGLWHNETRNGEPGYLFHDWLDYQQSAEEIERDRQRARERSRKYRKNLRDRKEGDSDED